ncbi:kinase-like domain-containing protein [Panaeolus papilionaceus]|nr:kinase-like domain-containing protein [Panaeolus papilionaceus]
MDSFDRDRHSSSNKKAPEHKSDRSPESARRSHSRTSSSTVEAYIRHRPLALMSRTPSPGSKVSSFKHTSSSTLRSNSAMQTQISSRYQGRSSVIHEPRSMKWIKGRLIGQGSYGKVYYAFNSTTGEPMAVKQVEQPETPSDYLKDSIKKMVQALKEENQTLRRLEHPNIVLYLGYEENPNTINIFLEYVPGGTIHSCLLKQGIFREEVTKSFAAQILDGLQYLHSKGIIHRDLKSENVLVEPHGVCKISDFGISKNVNQNNAERFTLMKGTMNWMSPEVITGDSDGRGYDEKIDIWSMGCLMREMWTARRPWENESVLQVMQELMDKRAPPMPIGFKLSPSAQDFNNLCFQPDPIRRPGADVLLQHYYLKLPAGWTFPDMNQMGLGKQRATNTDYRSGEVSSQSKSANDPAAEEVAEILSRTIKISALTSSEDQSPALTMQSVVAPDRTPPAPRRQSPPIVFIEPPPPRKRSISNDRLDDWMVLNRNSSLASECSSNQPTKPTRKLMIYNPDSNEKRTAETKKAAPFVYQPPPLPEKVPYSQQLMPIPKPSGFVATAKSSYTALSSAFGARSLTRHDAQSADAHEQEGKQQATKLRFVQSTPQSVYSSDHSYLSGGSEISTNSSMWQRAPTKQSSTKGKAPDHPLMPIVPSISTSGTRASPSQISSTTVDDERPDFVDVCQHMGSFFPHHNLDELVESPMLERGEDADDILGRRYTMKSIRAIAQEQAERSQRGQAARRSYHPQSPIWDTPLEEIKEHFR